MHTATLSLIEALLVGIAAKYPDNVLNSVEKLKGLRSALVGRPMDIANMAQNGRSPRHKSKE
jgi:hypothetical protein